MCLVETWHSGDVLDREVSIPNYTIVTLDRNRHGGGVAMYIQDSVDYNVILCGPAGLELLINPRRACAARVTVLGLSFCLSLCLSAHAILAVRTTKSITKDTIVLSVRFEAILKWRFS